MCKVKHIDWESQPLGQMKDAELGRLVGVSRENVRQQRAKRGIPPYDVHAQHVGKKFGSLKVLTVFKDTKTRFVCKCDCGNVSICLASNIVAGNTTSCGCKTDRLDITDKRYGKLTVLKLGKRKPKTGNHAYWLCRCDCGNVKEILDSNLKHGLIKSCGCLLRSKSKGYERMPKQ